MPRQARLDIEGALHHVMVRGLDGQTIFRDDGDREDFTSRLDTLVSATGLRIFAWVLMSNHAHLLVRTGPDPLSRVMRRLLTGYAVAFNRRHRRRGHLFQNCYRSVLVEEDPYLLEFGSLHPPQPSAGGDVCRS
jgi:REP element-mobilizing transposase RayT